MAQGPEWLELRIAEIERIVKQIAGDVDGMEAKLITMDQKLDQIVTDVQALVPGPATSLDIDEKTQT